MGKFVVVLLAIAFAFPSTSALSLGRTYNDNKEKDKQLVTCRLAKKKIVQKWFNTLFPWLEKCEEIFGFDDLKGYDTTRLYAFLAERYLSFWFKKYSNYKEQKWIFLNIKD